MKSVAAPTICAGVLLPSVQFNYLTLVGRSHEGVAIAVRRTRSTNDARSKLQVRAEKQKYRLTWRCKNEGRRRRCITYYTIHGSYCSVYCIYIPGTTYYRARFDCPPQRTPVSSRHTCTVAIGPCQKFVRCPRRSVHSFASQSSPPPPPPPNHQPPPPPPLARTSATTCIKPPNNAQNTVGEDHPISLSTRAKHRTIGEK